MVQECLLRLLEAVASKDRSFVSFSFFFFSISKCTITVIIHSMYNILKMKINEALLLNYMFTFTRVANNINIF